jgi:hypothetical protein
MELFPMSSVMHAWIIFAGPSKSPSRLHLVT